ncbi:alpha/beta hydrolase [Hydrogenophilus islandicus]
MTFSDCFVPVEGGTLYVGQWLPESAQTGGSADGVPLLLLHDSLGSVGLWRDFPAQLAQALSRPVYAYDRLGFGRSSARAGRPPLSFIADETVEGILPVLDALSVERAIVVGHSVGGAMAVAAAAQAPQRVAGVVTIAAQAFVEERTLAGIRAAQAEFADPATFRRLERWHGEKARWVLNAWTETWLDPAFRDWSLVPFLAQLTAPLLAIHGDRDEYGSTAFPETIVTNASAPAEAVVLTDCGHLPHRERPDAVIAAIDRWVNRLGE